MDGVPGSAVPGSLLDWNLGIIPGSQGGKFDLYAVLFLPGGTPLFLTPYGLESIIIPYGVGLTVKAAKFSLLPPFSPAGGLAPRQLHLCWSAGGKWCQSRRNRSLGQQRRLPDNGL